MQDFGIPTWQDGDVYYYLVCRVARFPAYVTWDLMVDAEKTKQTL